MNEVTPDEQLMVQLRAPTRALQSPLKFPNGRKRYPWSCVLR